MNVEQENRIMRVLMVCDYRSPNPGNFIPSIRCLDEYIHNAGGGTTVSYMLFAQYARPLNGASK